MKKTSILYTLSIFAIMLVLCFSFFDTQSFRKIVGAEEQAEFKQSLISASYSEGRSNQEVLENYNIKAENISNFTPFDEENETRMDGKSFRLDDDENNQILSQYVKVEANTGLKKNKDYALTLWIYFSEIKVHDLTISLKFSNNSTMEWHFSSFSLDSMLYRMDSKPYAWNRISMPFELATITGEIYSGNDLLEISQLQIDFKSDNLIEQKYAKLRFYDICLTEVADNTKFLVKKQKYNISSFNFFGEGVVDSLSVGDRIKLPTFTNAINYAWSGDLNVYVNGGPAGEDGSADSSIIWRVVIIPPDGEAETISFGDYVDFKEEGVYKIIYNCYNTNLETTSPILSGGEEIEVGRLNAIYFDKKELRVEVGKTYLLNIRTSIYFTDVSDIKFETSSDNVVVEYRENGIVAISAKEGGSYTVSAKVSGSRPASPEMKEYSVDLKVVAKDTSGFSKEIMKIVIYVFLGLCGVIAVIFSIKAIVKANKYKVR